MNRSPTILLGLALSLSLSLGAATAHGQGLPTVKPGEHTVILSPTGLAEVLRRWLGEFPDKVLFGTDAFDGGIEQGWEQVAWVGSMTARRALAIALTGMMRDGEISRERAEALARMVLRENAVAAYGLQGH